MRSHPSVAKWRLLKMIKVLDLCTISSKQTSLGRARLSLGRRESGQFPIIISFLTCQKFLGVLIGLVANGGVPVAFFGMLFGETEDLPMQNTSQFMFTPTSSDVLLLSMQYKSLMGNWPDSLPTWESGPETINKHLLQVSGYGYSGSSQHTMSSPYSVD